MSQAQKQIKKILEQAQKETVELLLTADLLQQAHFLEAMKQIREKYASLGGDVATFAGNEIKQTYDLEYEKTQKKFIGKGVNTNLTVLDFYNIDFMLAKPLQVTESIKLQVDSVMSNTAHNIQQQITQMKTQIGRTVTQELRENISRNLLLGETKTEIDKQIKKLFENNKIKGYTYVNKNNSTVNVSLDAFVDALVQQSLIQTRASATLASMIEHKYNLVYLSKHSNPSPFCEPHQGKVYSLTPNHPKYPFFNSILFDGKWQRGSGIFWRWCRHSITPYFESDIDFVQIEADTP